MKEKSVKTDAVSEQSTSKEMTFLEFILRVKNIIRYITSNWKIIVLMFIAGAVAGGLYAFYKPTTYAAATTFVLEDANPGGGISQYAGIASMIGVDVGGASNGIFQGDNIIELYKSRNMIQRALLSEIDNYGKKELLVDEYLSITKFREHQTRKELKDINFRSEPFVRLQDSVLGTVVQDIKTSYLAVSKLDKKLSIIQVMVSSPDETFAKMFCDQIVKTVNDFYVQTKTKKSLENLSVIQHQTDSVKNVLNGVLYQSVAVADATPNLNPMRLVLRLPVQKSQFNAEANKAILTQLVQNLELAKITLRKETPLIQVIDQPILPLPKEKLGRLRTGAAGGALALFITVFVLLIKWLFNNLVS
ncbi:MAG TPA: lipopolysaccharide biosynthesis protein [Mucilaginibacter sp.]